jgi:hypothetical protein
VVEKSFVVALQSFDFLVLNQTFAKLFLMRIKQLFTSLLLNDVIGLVD